MSGYREQAVSGVKWTGGSTAAGLILQLAQTAILARYLTAEDFGLFGESMVVVGISLALVDFGLSPAIVQREQVTDGEIASLLWIVAGLSAAIGCVVWLTAPLVAAFFGEPTLVPLVGMAAVFVALFGAGQVPLAVLQKALAFDRLSKVEIASAILGVAAAVWSAVDGSGAMAPLHGLVVSGTVRLVGMLIGLAGLWRPTLRLRLSDTRSFLSFGAYQTGERLVNYAAANLDFVMIGKFLGPAALGPYYIAYQVVVQPMSRLNPVLTRVAFPLFSKIQNDDAAIRRGYTSIIRLVAFTALPLLAGMAVVAPSFFRVYLGDGWAESVLLAQLLVPVALLQSLGNPLGSAFLAKGRPDYGFGINAGRLVLNGILFRIAVLSGPAAVAVAYGVSSVVMFVTGHVLVRRLLPIRLSDLMRAIAPTLCAACLMGLIVAAAQAGIRAYDVSATARLIGLVALGGLLYAALTAWLNRDLLASIRGWVSEERAPADA